MSGLPRTSTILTIAGATAVTGALAYAVYFDYKRRNDADFRKKLRKEKKRVQKAASASAAQVNVPVEELRAAVAKIRQEEVPEIGPLREAYFMEQVGIGEQLCAQGPAAALPAALSFFRALRVYPSPVELIMIYQKSVPEEVFKLVVQMTNLDVSDDASPSEPPSVVEPAKQSPSQTRDDEAAETSPERSGPPSETSSQDWDRLTDPGRYYNYFPAKSFNVSVQDKGSKKILVAEKDFETGDVIYTEEPVVTALDADLQELGTHCTHCLRLVHKGDALTLENDLLGAVYCSKECQAKSKIQSHGCLFLPEPLLPAEFGELPDTKARRNGQEAFAQYIKTTKKTHSLLVARFAARQVASQIAKLTQGDQPLSELDTPNYTEKGSPDYALGDHFERLRYVDVTIPDEEIQVVQGVFSNALPGLEQFLTDERHGIMLSQIAYNAIGVAYSGGRDDKPVFQERPEDQERTRTPHGTARQIGSGLYIVSSYIGHSCDPSAKPSFKKGNSELHLVATRPIKKGEEVTMSYVDVTQRPEETADESRRRRRFELARGWRFKCECSRCAAEATEAPAEENLGVSQDESRLDPSVQRFAARNEPQTETD
ncbi:MAS20-domain-containing protein [Trametopsis cervina]|nr:MAS20-domain-containing protein [Trametopsis cervina]